MSKPLPSLKCIQLAVSHRYGGIALFFAVFVVLQFVIRVGLMFRVASEISWNQTLPAAMALGFVYDLGAACWFALPLILVLMVLPARFFRFRVFRAATYLVALAILSALVFGLVSEWVFWGEFSTRFNFIAVDYLVYTTEVLNNIWESYPMPMILAGIVVVSSLLFWAIWKTGLPGIWLDGDHEKWRPRLLRGALLLLGVALFGSMLSSSWLPEFKNNYNREIAKDGLWSLFAAFRNNELDYARFYESEPIATAFSQLREELGQDGSVLIRPDEFDTLRSVVNPGPEWRPNIIQITVESLSARFLGVFNPESDLTPNLDALAEKSLFFDNCYATGTRTVRGMEALVLSLPPTPGRSIVKRPNNENLFSLGSVLRAKGYTTEFLYGGYGYFDNMNYFFGHNGYRILDRGDVADEDITFANAWGACDEDLYRWTMREADAHYASGHPFHMFLMTTSNHRPYTFPEGRIDLPSKVSGRAGAVKYTDYAIGHFIEEASSKPWFENTVFVIVADHCASSAGRVAVPVSNYHIPLFIYAPGGQIAPGHIETLTSQMDFAPTLLGLLNWSYPSRFFGHDVRRIDKAYAHALIGTYQKLGHLEDGELFLLEPRSAERDFRIDPLSSEQVEVTPSAEARDETIGYYQVASYMFQNGLYRALTPDEYARFASGRRLQTAILDANAAR